MRPINKSRSSSNCLNRENITKNYKSSMTSKFKSLYTRGPMALKPVVKTQNLQISGQLDASVLSLSACLFSPRSGIRHVNFSQQLLKQKKRCRQKSVEAVREEEVKLWGVGFVKEVGFKPGEVEL